MYSVVENALIRAAEKILGRKLTESEANSLVGYYRRADGTIQEKTEDALERFFGWSPEQRSLKASAADNTGRAIRELESVIRNK